MPNDSDLLWALIAQLDEFVVVLLDAEGKFTTWHRGVERLLGYKADEWIGQPAAMLFPEPDRSNGTAERELNEAATAGRASNTRFLVRQNGRPILVEGVTIGLRDQSGAFLGYGKVLRDVAEWKTAEENLAALGRALDQSTVVVRQWNGAIDHWTAGCERLYGWSAQEAVGRNLQDLLQTQHPAPKSEIEDQLRADGSWNGELEQTRRDGSQLTVSAHWALLSDPVDPFLSVIETHTDITGRLQMQQELQMANQRLQSMALELERSNEELEQFARIASHDLSAPIISTRWLVDLLGSRHAGKLDESGRKILTQVSQGLQRMSDLVDAVLAHAQLGTTAIGSGKPEQVREAVQAAMENLRRQVDVSGAHVECGPLPAANVEKHALQQLFQNLLSNAMKYRKPDASPMIRIAAERKAPMWEFTVADNGIGIAPEWHERIFQPMQRIHGLEIAGSGIGLATCKKIVTRSGGVIWVDSEAGVGSTFHFTLPGPAPVKAEEATV